MTRTIAITLAVFALLGIMTGCYPRATVVRYGVKGRIVDADTQQPLADTPLTVAVDSVKFTLRTTSKGDFHAPSEVYWNWNRFVSGPMYTSAEQAKIRITSPGYQQFRLVALAQEPLNPAGEYVAKINGSSMQLGDVELSKE